MVISSTSEDKNSVLLEAQNRDTQRSSSHFSDSNNNNINNNNNNNNRNSSVDKENNYFLPQQPRSASDVQNNNRRQYSSTYNFTGPSVSQPNRMNYFNSNSDELNNMKDFQNNNKKNYNGYLHNVSLHDMTNDATIDSGIANVYLRQREQDNDEVKKLLSIHLDDTIKIKELTEQLNRKNEELNNSIQDSISQGEEIERLKSELQNAKAMVERYETNEKRLDAIELFDVPIGKIIKNQISNDKESSNSIVELLKKAVPNVVGFLTTDYSKNVELLRKENENLRNMNEKITQDVKMVMQEKFNSISKDLLKNIENLNIVNENKVVEKIDEYKELFNELENLRKEMSAEQLKSQKLEFELETLKGNPKERLTFNNMKRPVIMSDKYNSLKLDILDNFNVVQLQNLIKRTSIELGLAVDSLEINLPRITVLLGLFSLLLKFTVWLSEEYLDVNLDFHKQVGKCIDIYLQTGEKEKAKESFEKILHRLEEIVIEQFDYEDGI